MQGYCGYHGEITRQPARCSPLQKVSRLSRFFLPAPRDVVGRFPETIAAAMTQPIQPRVLLTEGSSCTARTVLYALAGDHKIDILDPSSICQGRFSRFVHRWIRSPRCSSDPSAFIEFLTDHLEREHYDVVFPTHEEIFAIARAQDRIGRLAGLAVSSFAAIDCLISKANFSRLLVELDIPQPETTIVSTAAGLAGPWEFPVYIKS